MRSKPAALTSDVVIRQSEYAAEIISKHSANMT